MQIKRIVLQFFSNQKPFSFLFSYFILHQTGRCAALCERKTMDLATVRDYTIRPKRANLRAKIFSAEVFATIELVFRLLVYFRLRCTTRHAKCH